MSTDDYRELIEKLAKLEVKIENLEKKLMTLEEQYHKIFRVIVYGILLLLASLIASNDNVLNIIIEMLRQ